VFGFCIILKLQSLTLDWEQLAGSDTALPCPLDLRLKLLLLLFFCHTLLSPSSYSALAVCVVCAVALSAAAVTLLLAKPFLRPLSLLHQLLTVLLLALILLEVDLKLCLIRVRLACTNLSPLRLRAQLRW